MRFFLSFVFVLSVTLSSPLPIFAEDRPELDLPKAVELEKKNDVTAAMFSRLFGETWHQIVDPRRSQDSAAAEAQGALGEGSLKTEPSAMGGGLQFFSGIIVSILEVLNLGAMAFVATAILYMWGIFAVTTAHEGKKLGGSAFNSLWVPVRHAFSFSLVVPILNGLSLMQVAIIGCIGLSINFANVIWDASGKYIADHAHIGIIDSSAASLETEAYRASSFMFSDSVFQLMEMERKDGRLENQVPSQGFFAYAPTTVSGYPIEQSSEKSAPFLILRKKDRILVSLRAPEGKNSSVMSKISISCPTETKKITSDQKKKIELAWIRVRATMILWENLRKNANYYLSTIYSQKNKTCFKPNSEGICIKDIQFNETENPTLTSSISEYTKSITEASRSIIDPSISTDYRDLIRKSIDSDGERSKFGWASAGLFTFSLASLQKKIDSDLLQPTEVQVAPADDSFFSSRKKDEVIITNSRSYFANHLAIHSRFAAESDGTSDLGIIREIFLSVFADRKIEGDEAGGILGATLDEFGSHDPLIVIQTFGDRLLTVAEVMFGVGSLGKVAGIAASFFSDGLGGAFSELSGVLIMIAVLIFFPAILFAYIAPITPVIFWLRALVSWLFMVIEAMVAAPFWACSHALPEGTGFAGQHAKRGYMMLLQIVIYPALLVVGAVFAVAMVQAFGSLFNTILNSWFSGVISFISFNFFSDVVFSIVIAAFMYYLSFTIFTKGINYIPDRVLQWCGGGAAMGLRDETDSTKQIIMVGGAFNRAGSNVQSIGDRAGRAGLAIGEGYKKWQAKKDKESNDIAQIAQANKFYGPRYAIAENTAKSGTDQTTGETTETNQPINTNQNTTDTNQNTTDTNQNTNDNNKPKPSSNIVNIAPK